jgi:hypothetical protein
MYESKGILHHKQQKTQLFKCTNLRGYYTGNPTQSIYVDGIVYGIGYKQLVWKSLYIFGEANYAVDRPKQITTITDSGIINSTAKAVGYDFIVGIGYRF